MQTKAHRIIFLIVAFAYLYFVVVLLSFSPQRLNLLSGAAIIYDRSGNALRTVYQEQPARYSEVTLDQVPGNCINAVVAVEDRWFWENLGVDAAGLARLALNVVPLINETGGGSTITQQVIKLGTDRVIGRNAIDKVHESIRALGLTAVMPKYQILETYLNNAYYGNFIYGIETASQAYFGKPANQLDLAECAYLGGLPQSPSVYNPTANVNKEPEQNTGILRQHTVLDLMVRNGFISAADAEAARAQALIFQVTDYEVRAPHFIDLLAREIGQSQPEIGVINWNLPYDVHTTYDYSLHIQLLAELKTKVEQSGAADGAVIVLAPDGAVRVAIGSTQFFTAAEPNNWLQDQLPGTQTDLWNYAVSLTAGKLQPYFVAALTNRASGQTSVHIKQLSPETALPDISDCNCEVSITETSSGTQIEVLVNAGND